ncbi:conserved hypothetical protein [Tenacibaculum litopenaei]|uniref:2TM domain-containing protein n=1 Tax=Tenacibaculum litopenaei TaxID=396016 RepID=UPI00389367DB
MTLVNNQREHDYLRAKERVKKLKEYYTHLVVFLAVNCFLSGRKIYRVWEAGGNLEEVLTSFSTYYLWFFWGIGMLGHTFKMFGTQWLLGKEWEEKKIKEYMKE